MKDLFINSLCDEAGMFAKQESKHDESSLYGVTDGKAVGTYLEHKFKTFLTRKYKFKAGNSAKGIDFPELKIDLKVTSVKQPQSSCPYHSARQKIYGLGYSLLVFCYEKTDDIKTSTTRLNILHSVFIDSGRTADFQTTTGLLNIIKRNGNEDDLAAFILDRNFYPSMTLRPQHWLKKFSRLPLKLDT